MSQQEKTEKATPKKREDARKKGQVARGKELPTALGFFGALLVLNFLSDNITNYLGDYIHKISFLVAEPKNFSTIETHLIFIEGIKITAMLALPIIVVGLVSSVSGNFAQGGLSFSTEALVPKPEKFNPVTNIKNVFGLDALVNLAKSVIKLVFFGVVAYGVIEPLITNAPTLINAPIATVGAKLGDTLYQLAFRYGLVILILAIADYGYTVYKHEKSLRMTKQEIRDEFKQQEGDPLIKSQRRRAARALVQSRSLAEVPEASVVVTNPTHFAVALRYNKEKDVAPIVVAKGADLIAKKIREIARENNVPLIENPPLARALFKAVEPNQMVPIEFFGAVAEVLAYVFNKEKSGKNEN